MEQTKVFIFGIYVFLWYGPGTIHMDNLLQVQHIFRHTLISIVHRVTSALAVAHDSSGSTIFRLIINDGNYQQFG